MKNYYKGVKSKLQQRIDDNDETLLEETDLYTCRNLTKMGYRLDHFVNSKDHIILDNIILVHHYNLEEYSHSDDINILKRVIEAGYNWQKYLYSDNKEFRKAVAKSGNALDILKDDENWEVRLEVLKQGKFIESFMEDPKYRVRNQAHKLLNR